MIVGNGLIAKAFHENYASSDDVLIFASGVSNSSNTDPNEFKREKILLESYLSKRKKIIYFSTCSILDTSVANSPYVLHKLEMESLVKGTNNYLIFRLPQLAGKTNNPNTLLNFLYFKIKKQELFKIYSEATRNIIDIDDVKNIASHIIDDNDIKNLIVNIASPIYTPMINLITIFENVLKKKACYKIEERVSNFRVENNMMLAVADKINIKFTSDYVEKVLEKYFSESFDQN